MFPRLSPRVWPGLPLIIFAVSAFTSVPQAQAQTDIDSISLGDLLNIKVVTASRREEDSSMAPATIRVLTQKEIEDHGYKDLKDIFHDLPGFDISENVTGEVRTLAMARGILGENKLLILKDGKRINAITGERLVMGNNMPLFNVKRIEIMYGPGSVLYGADAYAGIVNMITKDYSDIKGGGKTGGMANISYGLKNTADVGVMAGTAITDDIDTTWSARYFKSDGQDPRNFPEFSNYSLNYSQPIKDYELYSRTRIGQAQLTLYRQDAREPGGPSTKPTSFDFNKDYVWHQIQNKVSLDHVLHGTDYDLQSTVSYEDYEIDPESNFYYLTGPAYKYGRNMALSLEEKLDYRFNESTSLVSGILVERVDAFAKGNNLASPYGRSDQVDQITFPNDPSLPDEYRNKTVQFGTRPYTSAGIYSEAKHKFNDKLLANVGARYDYNSDYYGIFTPRAGLVYKVAEPTTMKLLYGEAYIKPSRYLAYEHWSAGAFGYYPNPDLRPEQLRTIQFNIQHNVSSSFVVTLNTYYNFIHNLITPSNQGAWNQNVNNGNEETRGGELLFDYQLNTRLRANLYYSLLDAKQKNGPINKVANNKVNASATYTLNQFSFTPSGRWSDHVHYIDATAGNGIGQLNDYMVFDFATRWRGIFKNADVYLTVRNIFDRRYYAATPFGEGPEGWLEASAPQPGRTGELGFSYQF